MTDIIAWAVLDITFTPTPIGVTVTVLTDRTCHLWARYTTIEPQHHVVPDKRRGADVGTRIDQCFVAYTDQEQDELGDTTTHTFTFTDWPSCQTRWLFFFGTLSFIPTNSASPIFSYHRPYVETIYSSATPGDPVSDAYLLVWLYEATWSTLRNHPGDYAADQPNSLYADFHASQTTDHWVFMHRANISFDLSHLPTSSKIIAASITGRRLNTNDTHNDDPQIAWYKSYPASPAHSTGTDYSKIQTDPITTVMDYATFLAQSWPVWTLNPLGIQYLNPPRIITLGFREAKYDAPNIEPPWASGKTCRFSIYSTKTEYKPALTVYYLPK